MARSMIRRASRSRGDRPLVAMSSTSIASGRSCWQAPTLVRQAYVDPPAVIGIASACDDARLLHCGDRRQRGRLHRADALRELALGKAVFLPQGAQEVP